jgi:hypothetical protein
MQKTQKRKVKRGGERNKAVTCGHKVPPAIKKGGACTPLGPKHLRLNMLHVLHSFEFSYKDCIHVSIL